MKIIMLTACLFVVSACSGPEKAQTLMPKYPDIKYLSHIMVAAKTHNVDPALIAAVIDTESTFNPKAKSYTGAKGLMQLMPSTARYLGVKDAYDPLDNIMGGTKYLRELLDTFDGSVARAAAGYNAGPGAAKRMKAPHTFGYSIKVMKKYAMYSKEF
jgi:soluble lytic murein transglycosylase-like protein